MAGSCQPDNDHRSTLSPTNAKNTGDSDASTNVSIVCSVAARTRGICRTSSPNTNAPNTACTPIASVVAAHSSVNTRMSVRSAPTSGTLRFTQPIARVNPGYTTHRITAMNIASAVAVNASDPMENDSFLEMPAITESTSHPTVSSTTPADRIT